MEAYSSFAQVYDLFMDNIPYDEWTDGILRCLQRYGITGGIAADLGCGTGQITRRLARAGFDMIGIDSSSEMLGIAYSKEAPSSGILYLQQDLREMELYGTVRACICVCNTLNYLREEEDLLTVFRLVNNYLDPGGIFLADFNTPRFYEEIGSATIAENREDASFIWENEYDPEEMLNEYLMTFYIRDPDAEGDSGPYRRFEELHTQRAYTLPALRRCVERAGLTFLEASDADTGEEVSPSSRRVLLIARENGKTNK